MSRKATPDGTAARRLKDIGKRWMEEHCAIFPEAGSKWGFRDYEGRLGENSPQSHGRSLALTRSTLAEVEPLPEGAFHGDDWLDRRGFLSRLRTDLLFSGDLACWRTNPQGHCDAAVDSVFDLIVRHAAKPAAILPAVEARLAAIPGYLDAGASCLRHPVPLWTELAERSCGGAVEFLEGLQPELAKASPHPEKTASLLRTAAGAFKDYARAIRRKKPGPRNGYAIGRACFEFLIRERLGLDLTLPEARASGERQVALHEHLLREAAKRAGRRQASELIEQAASAWQPEGSLLEHYRAVTARIKTRLAGLDLVTLPKAESLQVLPVPAFLRHQFPTAAYSAPPPFSRDQTGIFWVNDLSLREEDPIRKAREVRQHFGLELTSIHEGYPGHHLQFVVQYRHPSRLRRLFEHSIFYEGWTMWCEKMAVEKGLADFPGAELVQLHDALWRAHRIVIDCGLHDGSLSPSAAARQLERGVGFTRARAAGDVSWYTSSPTVPMSYLLGRIELEKLHRRLCGDEGWTLSQFNDWILSHGALPWSWIWRARLEA